MYSRSTNLRPVTGDEVRVPKNYRGNAFSFDAPEYAPPVERESDLVPRNPTPPEEIPKPPECSAEHEEKRSSGLFGFSFDDLLIIALILILSQNGAEDDILILLAMLLAYGGHSFANSSSTLMPAGRLS